MTDTQHDNPNWIAELIQLLESQDAIVRELEAMGPRQASCIASGQVDDLLRAVRTVTPEAIREVVSEFEEIGCDEFIFVPVKPDVAHLEGLAETVF